MYAMKKFTLLLFVGILLLFNPICNAAQSGSDISDKISNYSRMMMRRYEKAETKAASNSRVASAPSFIESNGKTYVKSFVRFSDESALIEMERKGAILGTVLDGIATVKLPLDLVNEIASIETVSLIEFAQPVYTRLDSVRRCSNINAIHQGLAPLSKPYKGNGVIVGVVDEGFDFTHPNYYDATGTTYRVQKMWSQTASGNGSAPTGYSDGIEYTTPATIQAVQTDNTDETHGTHTSGIAAAGGYNSTYTGIAPESDIILVATDMSSTGIVDGVQYIINQAAAADKPCVVNLSLGSEVGPHDGTSASDVAIDQLCGAGAIVVGAAGNSGESAIHLQKQFTSGSTQSVATMLIPSDYTSTQYMIADIWGRNSSSYNVQVKIYNSSTGSYIAQTNSYPVNGGSPEEVLTGSTQTYVIDFNNQLYAGNGCYNSLIEIEPEMQGSLFNSTDMFVIEISHNQNDVVNMWATNGSFSSNGINGLTAGDTNYTVGEIGGTGKQIISVGAYATKVNWTPLSTPGEVEGYEENPVLYEIAPFSSKGPTADNRIKPDISAPGFGVVSGFNSWNSSYGASNVQTVSTKTLNGRSYYWGIDQGTSMACPVIAGTIALWLEANPTLTPAQIKNIFSEYAFSSTAQRALNQDNIYGWGKLDGFAGLQEAIALEINPVKEEKNPVIAISPNPNKGYFRITTEVPFTKIQLNDLSGRNIYQNELTAPQQNFNVEIDKMLPGIYMVSIFSENGVVTSKVIIH